MTAPVDSVTAAVETRSSPRRSLLPRWPAVVFPTVILAAMVFAAVHILNRSILPPALALATAAGLGLVSGFSARWALWNRADLLRALAALAGLTVGLLLLGLLTWGSAGVGPLRPSQAGPDWAGLGKFTLAAVAAWLALRAWRGRPTSTARRPLWQRPLDWWRASSERARSRLEEMSPGRWLGLLAGLREKLISRSGRRLDRAEPGERRLQIGRPSRRAWGARLPKPRKPRVRLGGVLQHRCPYCLELVERGDPRGVVTCSICHTRHHGDCWAVTGSCQVPHYHA